MFKVHASGASQIMTNPRNKSELLSETCKKYIRKQWITDKYNRIKDITSKPMLKGLMNEEQGITMLSEHLGEFLTKNDRYFSSEYMVGTPDIIHESKVYDIKCSYDIFTFMDSELTDAYEWQLQIYMHLLGLTDAALVYVLTDTPMSIIQAEVKSICWKLQDDSEALDIEIQLMKQMMYPDIPQKDRIKVIEMKYNPDMIFNLIDRVKLCQDYYNGLTLNGL